MQNLYTKLSNYKKDLSIEDKILYIAGDKANNGYLKYINEYMIMPIKIERKGEENHEETKRYNINSISGNNIILLWRNDKIQ